MSAIPKEALKSSNVSEFHKILAERPDDALLTDDEVFNLKGGYTGLAFKCLFGFAAVGSYLFLSKRIHEVKNLNNLHIKGSTFLYSNLVFLLAGAAYQDLALSSSGNLERVRLHRSALYQRFMMNYQFMIENRKKPKIH